jgi:hypothetical protein
MIGETEEIVEVPIESSAGGTGMLKEEGGDVDMEDPVIEEEEGMGVGRQEVAAVDLIGVGGEEVIEAAISL